MQLFHSIFQHNFLAEFVHLICQPNLANHFFKNIFSPIPFSKRGPPNSSKKCVTPFSTEIICNNFKQIFQINLILKFCTHFFTHLSNHFSNSFAIPFKHFTKKDTLLLFFCMLYTASHILDTEFLSSIIRTETRNVGWGVPVAGLKKKNSCYTVYMGDTE